MKTAMNIVLLCALVFVLSLPAIAASPVMKPEVVFRQSFPDVPLDDIHPTDIPGMYEIVSGQNILYFFPEKEYLFAGEIYTKDRKTLSAPRKKQLKDNAAKLIKTLPLEKAVKIGSGKHTIIEFTDPDCPYCRKASEFLKKRKDVTRYVFLAVLANHPQAINKIHHILSAKDKAAAYEEMMSGKPSPKDAAYSEAIKSLAQEHLALAKKVGVSGTPTFFVNGQEVVGADEKKIESLLK